MEFLTKIMILYQVEKDGLLQKMGDLIHKASDKFRKHVFSHFEVKPSKSFQTI